VKKGEARIRNWVVGEGGMFRPKKLEKKQKQTLPKKCGSGEGKKREETVNGLRVSL